MDSIVGELLSQATSLADKFQEGETRNINEVIALDREALNLCVPDHLMRSSALNQLATHLWHRYKRFGGIDDLHEAIDLGQEALALYPLGHPARPTALKDLAFHLFTRYNCLGKINDLNEAIILGRNALALVAADHPVRLASLNNLAASLSTRYDKLGGNDDLNEAIILTQEALALCPPWRPERSTVLNNLSAQLSSRYRQHGVTDDLNAAIDLTREALQLNPVGHEAHVQSLNNLACQLFSRYNHLGVVADLDEAVALSRDALKLRPHGHPDRSTSLNNLAAPLSTRFRLLGGIDDLNEAIILSKDALALRPLGHLDRSMSLNNLAFLLSTRYEQLGGVSDLNEAIVYGRDALALRPPGHPDRSISLNNLAFHLGCRYRQLGRIGDLNEAIDLDRAALTLRPSGHPDQSRYLSNLALDLSARHQRLGNTGDLDEAIVLGRDALVRRPPGHPERSRSLENLAGYLRVRFTLLGRVEDQEDLFSLYLTLQHISQTVSTADLLAAKAWTEVAETFHHPSTLLAYETALRLLVEHLAALPPLPRHLTVLKSLSSSLAMDAFSACLRNKSPKRALELLEQGRGVFWSQLTRLRSPLDDVIASGSLGKALAENLTCLSSLIRIALDSPGADQHDRVCHLSVQFQGVVSKIRSLPGLSRFLLPLLFSDLRRAANGGPVIVVNASKHSCDVLIVFADKDPIHIPLSVSKEDVCNLSSTLRASTKLTKRLDVTRDLGLILRELWDRVVSPIVDVLEKIHPYQSRIWWCPTAEFSHLPLHAAGPYRKGQRNLSDLYISSYTPTLNALIRARHHSATPATQQKRFIAIGHANARGADKLSSVGPELANIGRLVDGLTIFERIEGPESSIARVADELGKHEWVHFACHGVLNRKQPFESAFALHDGRFTIQRILQCELENPEFAYLSACHTTVGDEGSPDEAIHLASAMQFAGFRSVIGTMWAVDDAHTNEVTSVFYKHMMDESGRLDHTRAASALRRTMKSVDIPLDQRILYLHLGA